MVHNMLATGTKLGTLMYHDKSSSKQKLQVQQTATGNKNF